jgi:hypothetical protein
MYLIVCHSGAGAYNSRAYRQQMRNVCMNAVRKTLDNNDALIEDDDIGLFVLRVGNQ